MNTEKLKSLAAQGTVAFVSAVPHVALGVLTGAVVGLVLMFGLGAGLAFGSSLLWRETALPSWLSMSLVATPVVLALTGVYVGGVRGFFVSLAGQLAEKKLLAWVYAQVKPAALAALARAKGGDAQAVADEVQRQVTLDAESTPKPESFADRAAQFLTLHSRRVLALTLVAHLARAKSGEEARAEVEKLGLAKLEHIVLGQLEDLFSLQLTLVTGAAFLICLAPQAVFWLSR